jgi:hypothetical protein
VVNRGIRSWFVRDLLDLLERGGGAGLRLQERLPQRLAGHADLEALRLAGPTDVLSLDDGEELLLTLDAVLGDGSGRVLEGASLELAARMLAQGVGGVVAGDLMATVARMRAVFERPYLGIDVAFQLTATETGFALALSVTGRPRSARLLRHLALGSIRAAQRFSRGADEESLKLYAETIGDRTSITAQYREPRSVPADAKPSTRRPSRSFRVGAQHSLTEQVERILNRATTEPPPAPRRPTEGPSGRLISSPPPPAERSGISSSERPPPNRREASVNVPRSPRVPSVTLRENEAADLEVVPADRPTPIGGGDPDE